MTNLGEDLTDIKVEDEEERMMGDLPCKSEVEEDIPGDVTTDGSRRRNPPERCPRPLYSQDCPEEKVPEHPQMINQGQDLSDIKVEDEEERMMVDPPCGSEVEEDIPGDVPTENPNKNFDENFMLSLNDKAENEDIIHRSSGGILITLNLLPGHHSTDLSYNPLNHEKPSSDQSQIVSTSTGQKEVKGFQHCKDFTKTAILSTHRIPRGGEKKSFPCLECGKCFQYKSLLVRHERHHTGEKPYSCSECGKGFKMKSYLAIHERTHTGEKPYSCSECGRCFTEKSTLVVHERIHTGERPYVCSECGRRFTQRSDLVKHERTHTGEKPYSCSECGRCFTEKSALVAHERIHTGARPYVCSECGRRFKQRSDLVKHERRH
ncbi:zinc finger protein 501-like [Bufo gargarizans]|uniref:zinc finger protein 501-like n=1 Tax=Bufo gargarizans TaxID=30331 RepID=UPI001CF4F0B9|nr:zinc finger protein 501-like [Bufo gargarizans]